jgi:geranylgeranyl diphosphate synthase, type II
MDNLYRRGSLELLNCAGLKSDCGMANKTTNRAVELLGQHGQQLHDYFEVIRGRYGNAPPRLVESIQYSLLAGGKRLRPALVLECCEACLGNKVAGRQAEARKSALAAGAAMEFIHTFSLVHDDLPAMDDDDLRRGRPTNHKVFGEAMAVLAGDAMVTMAFEILAGDAHPAVAIRLIAELAHATGPEGMIGGQVLDIDGEQQSLTLEELQRVHRMKTGALLTASCRLGAMAAEGSEAQVAAVTEFGRHLGLAFQIVDDVLDVTSTPEQMGKATNKDAAKGKNTYPKLIGLEESKREAQRQLALSLEALAVLGPQGNGLADLARFVVERDA